MSLQVAIMKVLSGHPRGRAALADLNADLAVLNAVADWTSRMRRLALRKPDLDIFSQGIVVRDDNGWTLTARGFRMLETLERPETTDLREKTAEPVSVAADSDASAVPLPRTRPPKRVATRRMQTSRLRRGDQGLDRSA